jgi:hypothetical protein
MGKVELVQAVVDPVTGAVLHEPGEVFDEKHAVVKLAGQTAFRPVDEPEPAPEDKPAAKVEPKQEEHKKAAH